VLVDNQHPTVLPKLQEVTTTSLPDGTPVTPKVTRKAFPVSIRATEVGSDEELELRVTEDSSGKCIRVAYYAGDQIRKIVWEPARTWSRN
jgi:hypothetical protein